MRSPGLCPKSSRARRHGGFALAIKHGEFVSLKQLTHMATEYGSVKQLELIRCGTPGVTGGNREGSQLRRLPNPFRNSESTTQGTSRVDEQRACGRCGENEHFRRVCPNTRRDFCWDCGRVGVLTRVLPSECLGKWRSSPPEPECNGDERSIGPTPANPPLRVHGGLIMAAIEVGRRCVDDTVDTGASRSFASESFTNLVARAGEVRDVVTRIPLADRSCLDVTKLWRTPVTLAGTTVLSPMLVMPTKFDRVILGMDFLKTAGTRVRCGQATLDLQPEPQAVGDPLLLPVLIPPRDDRGDLGTARQGGPEVLSPTPTLATATTDDTGIPLRMEAGQHDEERQIIPLSLGQQGFIDQELALFESLQGVSHVAEHRIVMRDDKPLKQRYYPRNPAMQHVIDTQVNELLLGRSPGIGLCITNVICLSGEDSPQSYPFPCGVEPSSPVFR